MLEKNRLLINEIDKEIIQLLEKRYDAAKNIANYKLENNLPVFDKSREELLFSYYKTINMSENKENIEKVLRKIIEESKNIQQNLINQQQMSK